MTPTLAHYYSSNRSPNRYHGWQARDCLCNHLVHSSLINDWSFQSTHNRDRCCHRLFAFESWSRFVRRSCPFFFFCSSIGRIRIRNVYLNLIDGIQSFRFFLFYSFTYSFCFLFTSIKSALKTKKIIKIKLADNQFFCVHRQLEFVPKLMENSVAGWMWHVHELIRRQMYYNVA